MKPLPMLAVTITSLLAGSVARADEDLVGVLGVASGLESLDTPVAAPSGAIEIGIAAGYTQGVGPIGGRMLSIEDLSKAGGVVELDAMYRITPTFAVGAYGTLSKLAAGDQVSARTDVLGATAGIQAAAHLRPERAMDPWLSVGTGWRGMWLAPETGKHTAVQGLELARVQLGIDYRINENVAIAPIVGGSLNLFISEDSPMTSSYTELATKKLDVVGFIGLAGHFEISGK